MLESKVLYLLILRSEVHQFHSNPVHTPENGVFFSLITFRTKNISQEDSLVYMKFWEGKFYKVDIKLKHS